ncbi:nicalin [Octopus sinensis]|uniref:Nicalin n=1 Tax=Octopus sinensis TaxID=2607531 RepID=A0A6P7SNL0_9MOLL|nr:nicalin [Octopus sinensis]
MFDEAGEVFEMFRNNFPMTFICFVPLLILMSPVIPARAAHEFAVYRMHQYDLHGTAYGCRSSFVNMEARSVDAKMLTRRCIIVRLRELTVVSYRKLVSQNVGAVLVLLPDNFTNITVEEKERLYGLERDLLLEETNVPVFFAYESEALSNIYIDVKHLSTGDQAPSALEALLSAASANGFQMVVSGAQAKALPDFQITNIQGRLAGYGIEEQLPSVIIVAHYDSMGIAPGLSEGADSNGSGVVTLLELARLFSKLYTNSRTHAKYNLVFLLTGGGKFNYQGTKRWIEDSLESTDNNQLTDVAYVLCLDTIGTGNTLNLHVSKPPREDSAGGIFLKNLEEITKKFFPDVQFKMIHKKINLAEDTLAWEHERFSIKRLPAFSLSRLDTHKTTERATVLDVRSRVDTSVLSRNIQIIAEALARHIYNLTNQGQFRLFTDGLEVQDDLITAWLDCLTSQPRATPLIPKDHSIITNLEETLSRYLKDVRVSGMKADKRDPEFLFYDGAVYSMNAYNVKPAIFDLFLAVGIGAYLAVVYLIVQNFHLLKGFLQMSVQMSEKLKSH